MDIYGLALCGGGAKGAFHIGMWKALLKFHYAEKIKAVSGTSVGALNAVLFSLGDYERARDIWYSIEPDMFLSIKSNGNSLFSRDGLIQIIDSLNLSKLKLDVYVNVYNTETNQTESYHLNKYDNQTKRQLLLASTALPIAYEKVEIGNTAYHDGGLRHLGNIPIDPLYKNGYRNIIIGALDHTFNPYHIHDSIIIKNPYEKIDFVNQYPNCSIKSIVPLEDLGDLLNGTLNFSKIEIRNKMVQGYQDTKKQLINEDVFIMKNNYSKINVQIRSKMECLFKNAAEIDAFIKCTNFGEINIPAGTLGGMIWYENIVELYGWKVQQHKLLGFQSHYRFLDHNNVRRAWVLDPMDIIRSLEDYEAAIEIDSPAPPHKRY